MMKWRRRSASCSSVRDRDIVDSPSKEEMFSRSYNEAELLASFARDSPFEELMYDDVYNRFKIEHKRDSEDCTDVFVVSTPKNKYHIRPKSERRLSPANLPSIEEGVESDELASIADSGICDDDLDFDIENGSLKKNKSYFEPLKNFDDEELYRRRSETDELSPNNNKSYKHDFSTNVSFQNLENIKKSLPLENNNANNVHLRLSKRKLQRPFSTDLTLALEKLKFDDGTNNNLSASKIRSRSLDNLITEMNETSINNTPQKPNIKPIKPTSLPLFTTSDNTITTESIDTTHNQIFTRLKLKADLEKTVLKTKDAEASEDIDLPSSLMSSMLWNGQTSTRPPSSCDIYQTMPANRYTKRNKDFMTQIKGTKEDLNNAQRVKEFKVHLDVIHYAPEEILVTLEDGKLIVNGKHFSESEYGFESCQFHRRYPIPDGIRKADIKSSITENGILTITGRAGPPEIKAKPVPKLRPASNYDNVRKPVEEIEDGCGSSPKSSPQEETKVPSPLSRRQSPDGSPASPTKIQENRPQKTNVILEDEFNDLDDETLLLKVNCAGYTPDDMEVRVTKQDLVVRARKKTSQMDNGQERHRQREFTKRFAIPSIANCNTITSRFTDQEILYVECKKLKPNPVSIGL